MDTEEASVAPTPSAGPAPPPPRAEAAMPPQGPIAREATPSQIPGLAGSGYASQQALLDSMFPHLGSSPAGQTPSFPAPINGLPQPAISADDHARLHEVHERIRAKIESMSKYNNLMGSSDKDFITRIQLSQLATTDPYTSDFYAQVFSTIQRSRMAALQQGGGDAGAGPSVVQLTSGLGFGVGGPGAGRFGKMGQNTMQKLNSQVKKLVESRQQKASAAGERGRLLC